MRDEKFIAKLQRNNRIQVPVLIRWKHKLEPGDVLDVYVRDPETWTDGRFYARLSRDGRFTIPKIMVEKLEAEPGDVLQVTLYAERGKSVLP